MNSICRDFNQLDVQAPQHAEPELAVWNRKAFGVDGGVERES